MSFEPYAYRITSVRTTDREEGGEGENVGRMGGGGGRERERERVETIRINMMIQLTNPLPFSRSLGR